MMPQPSSYRPVQNNYVQQQPQQQQYQSSQQHNIPQGFDMSGMPAGEQVISVETIPYNADTEAMYRSMGAYPEQPQQQQSQYMEQQQQSQYMEQGSRDYGQVPMTRGAPQQQQMSQAMPPQQMQRQQAMPQQQQQMMPHQSQQVGSGGRVYGVGVLFAERIVESTRLIEVFVKQVYAGGPADQSGQVKVGDVLVAVNNNDVVGQNLQDLRLLVPGPLDSQVTLGFVDEGHQRFDVILTRGPSNTQRAQEAPEEAVEEVLYASPGFSIQETDDGTGFMIANITKDSSAEEQGLEYGERLLAINGKSTQQSSEGEIKRILTEEYGTLVTLQTSARSVEVLRDCKAMVDLSPPRRAVMTTLDPAPVPSVVLPLGQQYMQQQYPAQQYGGQQYGAQQYGGQPMQSYPTVPPGGMYQGQGEPIMPRTDVRSMAPPAPAVPIDGPELASAPLPAPEPEPVPEPEPAPVPVQAPAPVPVQAPAPVQARPPAPRRTGMFSWVGQGRRKMRG
mmetsp:Transcript_13428/g.31016  ORF Transcript_13428/g.31016 Transcript_13428/m.31016 type:complete len:503 (-) Transcript_13428:284-1792(-)